jgi:hypothetical protein
MTQAVCWHRPDSDESRPGQSDAQVERVRQTNDYKYSKVQLSTVGFEPNSKLSRIEAGTVSGGVILREVRIHSAVETLCEGCFSGCECLSTLTFASPSRLSWIGVYAFCRCIQPQSICIPSSVEELGSCCFHECRFLSTIKFESDRNQIRSLGTLHFAFVSSSNQFVFLLLSQDSAGSVSSDVGRFRQSHSNPVRNCQASNKVHLNTGTC